MIKRILGLVLCLTMILSTATIGLSAVSYKPTVGTPSADADYTGFTLVTDASTFATKVATANAKILLGNDLTLTGSYTPANGVVIDGNGYTIQTGTRTTPLFSFTDGGIVTIRNVNFGSSAAPITVSGNNGLFAENNNNRTIWENVAFYVNVTGITASTGALFTLVKGVQEFYGCSLKVNINTNIDKVAGWTGTTSGGQLTFSNCQTDGTINAGSRIGAWIGERGTGRVAFTDCINFAKISGTNAVGGYVGNTGSGGEDLTFTNCQNRGAITASGTGYDGMAGGFVGRMTNPQGYGIVNAFYDCVNYGTITSGSSAGGFVGRNHDYDYDTTTGAYVTYAFRNCLNVGTITGSAYAGGFMGVASMMVENAEFTKCANIGKISANQAGNFGGMLYNSTLTDCYAGGVVVSTKGGDNVSGDLDEPYVRASAPTAAEKIAYTVVSANYPKCTNVSALVGLESAVLNTKLGEMKQIFGMSFVKADAADSAEALVVIADPQLRGYQIGANGTQGKVDIRFSAALNALEAYDTIGFRVSAWENGAKIAEYDRTGTVVYRSIRAVEGNSGVKEITAESLSAKYIFSFTLKNVPTDRDITLQVTPYAKMGEIEYSAGTRTVTCHDGTFTQEPMILNNVSLERFAVVYPTYSGNTGTKNQSVEHMLAQRLADKIATITGQTVACYAAGSAKNANEIWVKAPVNNGERTISVAGNNVISLQAGTDTALSEVVQYFIDQLTEKKQSGQSVWKIETTISVPVDEELSIMAYNLGAKDDAYIKQTEWDLIVDYLPDVMTLQEPWAGFLDDFMNDYAVQPTVDFKSKQSYTSSKAGTTYDSDWGYNFVNSTPSDGSAGYYGIYWGQPRWSGSSGAGRASYSVILYAKDRFTVDESHSGTFWFSTTPNVSSTGINVPAAGNSANFARCATYATLVDNNTGEKFVVVNAHLDTNDADHTDRSDVRKEEVRIMLEQLTNGTRVETNIPIFITGDMNASRNSSPMNFIMDAENGYMQMHNIDMMADRTYRTNTTIDWIFTNVPNNVEVSYYKRCVERTAYNTAWSSGVMHMPSDHPAVYAELILDTGNTTGEADRKNRVDLDTVEVELAQGVFTYDGEAKMPDVIFKGTTLTKDKDYTLSYQNNVNAGTATVTITAKDGGRCDGGPRTLTFTITALTLTEADVSYDAYAGSEPVVTVVVNGKTLTEGTDYEAEYDVETNIITVTGKGNYAGTVEVTVKMISVEVDPGDGNPGIDVGDDTHTDFGPVQWF